MIPALSHVMGILGSIALMFVVAALYNVILVSRRQGQLYVDKVRDRLLIRAANYAEEHQRKRLKESGEVIGPSQKLRAAVNYLKVRYELRSIECPADVLLEEDIESVLPQLRGQHVKNGEIFDD